MASLSAKFPFLTNKPTAPSAVGLLLVRRHPLILLLLASNFGAEMFVLTHPSYIRLPTLFEGLDGLLRHWP